MTAIVRPSSSAPGGRQWPDPPLRLVRGGRSARPSKAVLRGRRLLVAVVVLAMAVALVAVLRLALVALAPDVPGAHAAPGSSPAHIGRSGVIVVVRPGDTLWTIARRLAPAGDVRPVVDRLAAAHGTGPLHPGERLSVSDAVER